MKHQQISKSAKWIGAMGELVKKHKEIPSLAARNAAGEELSPKEWALVRKWMKWLSDQWKANQRLQHSVR